MEITVKDLGKPEVVREKFDQGYFWIHFSDGGRSELSIKLRAYQLEDLVTAAREELGEACTK